MEKNVAYCLPHHNVRWFICPSRITENFAELFIWEVQNFEYVASFAAVSSLGRFDMLHDHYAVLWPLTHIKTYVMSSYVLCCAALWLVCRIIWMIMFTYVIPVHKWLHSTILHSTINTKLPPSLHAIKMAHHTYRTLVVGYSLHT